jgi:AmiR/NasT family two-component response regulator
MAVGLLMMRDRMNREQAFDTLRGNARAQRRPIGEVAKELLSSAENLYTIKKIEKSPRRRKGSGND